MDETCLSVNLGSASKKYGLFRGEQQLIAAHFEKMPQGYALSLQRGEQILLKEKMLTEAAYHDASATLKGELSTCGTSLEGLAVIGVRVVAPGSNFQAHGRITLAYEERLTRIAAEAPLHLNPLLEELTNLRKHYPDTPIMGISDSAFHRTMPIVARLYGIPRQLASENDLYRFGYHGLSLASVVRQFANMPERVVVLHLGSGASVTAIRDRKSIETSMGFTPLEGLLMSTRCGTIDAGLVLALVKKLGVHALEELLEKKSGLLGVSSASGDIRELLKRETAGDVAAHEALELFIYQIRKQIGAAVAVLGGVDTMVFTGTIGERSSVIRKRVVQCLGFLKVALDDAKNEASIEHGGEIHVPDSATAVLVIPAKEDEEIARESFALLTEMGR